jgi:hypothetical protein
MQIKHVGLFKKDLLKNDFVHEKCPITVLISSVEFYKSLEIGLTLFGCNMPNLWKKQKTEKEKGSEQKKRRQPNWADPGPNPAKPAQQQPEPFSFPFLFLFHH